MDGNCREKRKCRVLEKEGDGTPARRGGGVQRCGHRGREFASSLETKHGFPRAPAAPPPGMGPKELKAGARIAICAPVFTAALFTVAKRRRDPSVEDEQTKCGWST